MAKKSNGSDFGKSVQESISMPEGYWEMLDWLIDQQDNTSISQSEMIRICIEEKLHRQVVESDPGNKKNRAFFKRLYGRISDDDSV